MLGVLVIRLRLSHLPQAFFPTGFVHARILPLGARVCDGSKPDIADETTTELFSAPDLRGLGPFRM